MKCFRVKTKDSTFWFPTNEKENPRIRPVSTKGIIEKVIQTLRRKSTYLDTDRNFWKEQIKIAQSEGDLVLVSKVIRDLSAQKVIRKLNVTEEKALDSFKERLVREWAAILDADIGRIRPEMNAYIQESKNKIKIDK